LGTRRVATRDGAGRIAVIDQPIPEPAAGQVQIEVKASMISPGTELGRMKRARENPGDSPPRTFGYTNAGVVIKQGEGCEDIPLGTRLACMGGGYAEHTSHAVVPRNLTTVIPDAVSFDHAASIHLAATGLNAIRRAQPEVAEYAAVIGLGIVGQFTSQWARLSGCHTMGLDRLPLRLERAVEAGLERPVNVTEEDPLEAAKDFSRERGMDFGVLAFGGDGNEVFANMAKMLKRAPDSHQMGRIVVVGSATFQHSFAAGLGARTGPGYHDEAWEHGADYPPAFVSWTTSRNLEECLRFMEQGSLRVEPLITHRVSLEEAPEVCDILVEEPGKALGVILNP
jgi:threonine dehydrogenase-like Zn-dependent dehydrogenase